MTEPELVIIVLYDSGASLSYGCTGTILVVNVDAVMTIAQVETPSPAQVLLKSAALSVASSVLQSYPSITCAYLFGSYAKGTARPDSDVDIAIFHPDLIWDKNRQEIGGVHMDLEDALNKEADLSVCLPDTFVERIKKYWVPINVGTQKSSSLLSSSADATHPPVALPSMSS